MNIKEYISSGILEQYLLGELTAAEEKEVEVLMTRYPEIRQEYFTLADTFEKMSLQTAQEPPSELKDRIMNEIGGIPPVKSPPSDRFVKPSNNLVLALGIASLVGLLIATIFAATCIQSKKSLNEQITGFNAEIDRLESDNQQLTDRLDQLSQDLQIMGSPEYNQVNLNALPIAPQAYARVFWNQQTQDIFLKADHLPAPEASKQYQLWAIVNNNPVSIGVFDIPADSSLIRMTGAANASAFAVTLEARGGVQSPTLDAMYVIGNVI